SAHVSHPGGDRYGGTGQTGGERSQGSWHYNVQGLRENMEQPQDLTIQRLGECTVPSPMSGIRFTKDDEHVLLHSDLNEIKKYLDTGIEPPRFEAAGPREKIFFDPATLNCGIV